MTDTIRPPLFLLGKNAKPMNLVGMAVKALNAADRPDDADKLFTKCVPLVTVEEVLLVIMEYVEIK